MWAIVLPELKRRGGGALGHDVVEWAAPYWRAMGSLIVKVSIQNDFFINNQKND